MSVFDTIESSPSGSVPRKLDTKDSKKTFFNDFDNYLFDCDGVIWQGSQLLPGSDDVLKHLYNSGKKVMFVTNNASKSRRQYIKKFTDLGLDFVKPEDIHCTANATAEFLMSREKPVKKVFCIGVQGLADEMQLHGFEVVSPPDRDTPMEKIPMMGLDQEVGAVVVGLDTSISYPKIAMACMYLRYIPGCLFVATNRDAGMIQGEVGKGKFLAGAGTMVAAIEVGCGRKPDAVIGKPNEWWIKHIIESNHLKREKTIMIGDRLDTDIVFAEKGGISSLLVLTGVTEDEDALSDGLKHFPSFVAISLGDLREAISS